MKNFEINNRGMLHIFDEYEKFLRKLYKKFYKNLKSVEKFQKKISELEGKFNENLMRD